MTSRINLVGNDRTMMVWGKKSADDQRDLSSPQNSNKTCGEIAGIGRHEFPNFPDPTVEQHWSAPRALIDVKPDISSPTGIVRPTVETVGRSTR